MLYKHRIKKRLLQIEVVFYVQKVVVNIVKYVQKVVVGIQKVVVK